VYLILGAFWFVLGVGMLAAPYINPQWNWVILDTGISFGWLLLGFSLFNFLKWWLIQRLKKVRMREEELARTMRSRHRDEREYDPTFDFSEDKYGQRESQS